VPGSGSQLTRILRSYQPGEKLTLRIMRDRKPLDMEVTLPEVDRTRGARSPRAAWVIEDGQIL
jgi:S1-C subfamily serine protease